MKARSVEDISEEERAKFWQKRSLQREMDAKLAIAMSARRLPRNHPESPRGIQADEQVAKVMLIPVTPWQIKELGSAADKKIADDLASEDDEPDDERPPGVVIEWTEEDERLAREEADQPIATVAPAKIRFRQLMALMERPFFALQKARTAGIDYVSPDGRIRVRVEGGPAGIATTYDADLLMFLVSRIADGELPDDGTMVFSAGEFSKAIGSKSGGDQYRLLAKSIERLTTTSVETNCQPDGKPGSSQTFRWLEKVTVLGAGRWSFTPASWLLEGARSNYVLSVSSEYFDLGGYERFLYLTARKHVGRDVTKKFHIKIETLLRKSGSVASLPRFKFALKKITVRATLPDYWVSWHETAFRGARIEFSRRGGG